MATPEPHTMRIAGGLEVASDTLLHSSLVANDAVFNGNLHISGNVLCDGGLTVISNSTIAGKTFVADPNAPLLLNNVTIQHLTVPYDTSTSTLAVTSHSSLADATFSGTTSFAQPALFQNNVTVNGNTVLGIDNTKTLTVNAPTTLKNGLVSSGATALQGTTATALSTTTLNTASNTTVGGSLSVSGPSTLGSDVTVAAGHTLTSNSPLVLNASASFGDTVTTAAGKAVIVNGPSTFNDLSTFTAAVSVPALTVSGAASFALPVIASNTVSLGAVSKAVTIVGPATLQNGLTSTASTTALGATSTAALISTTIAASSNLSSAGNLTVAGTSGFTGDTTAQKLTLNNTLTVNSTSALNDSVSIAAGKNLAVGGALSVSSPATFASSVTAPSLSVTTGLTSVQALTAAGATSLQACNVSGGLISSGAVTMGNSTTGTTTVLGPLSVAGSSLFQNVGASAINATSLSTVNSVTAGGTLSVTGTTTLNGDLSAQKTTVSGMLAANSTSTFADTVTIAAGKNLSVGGSIVVANSSSFASSLTANALSVGTTTTLTGPVSASSTLAVTGAATLSNATANNVTVNTSITNSGTTNLQALTATGINATTIATSGSATLGTTLTVAGDATLNGNITQPLTKKTTVGTLEVLGSTQLDDNVTLATGKSISTTGPIFAASAQLTGALVANTASVTGSGTFGGAVSSASLTTSGNATFGTTSANSLSAQAVNVAAGLSVLGSTTLANTTTATLNCTILAASGASTVGGTLQTTGIASFYNDVTVASTQTLTDYGALIVGKTSQFNDNITVATGKTATFLGPIAASTSSVSTGALSAGSLTVSGASALQAINVAGNAIFSGTVSVADTKLLSVGSAGVSSSGPITTGGGISTTTLSASGASTLSSVSASSLNVSGPTSLAALSTSGAASFASTVTSTGLLTAGSAVVNGTSTLKGSTTIGTGAVFTVTDSQTILGGGLNVAGAANFGFNVNIATGMVLTALGQSNLSTTSTGALTSTTGLFNTALTVADTMPTVLGGTMRAKGNTTLDGTLSVGSTLTAGATTLSSMSVSGTSAVSTLTATGALIGQSSLAVSGLSSLSGGVTTPSATVTTTATLPGLSSSTTATSISTPLTLTNNVTVSAGKTLAVNSPMTVFGVTQDNTSTAALNALTATSAVISGSTTLSSVAVSGNAAFNGAFSVTTPATLTGGISNALTINNSLSVTGTTSHADTVTISAGKNLLANGIITPNQSASASGLGRGYAYSASSNTSWATYLAQAGATNSFAGATAPAMSTVTGYALRLRAPKTAGSGFLFENDTEQAIMSLDASSGNLSVLGLVNASSLAVIGNSSTASLNVSGTGTIATLSSSTSTLGSATASSLTVSATSSLAATGTTTLTTTGLATLASASVTGTTTLQSTLAVTGGTSLAGLAVSGTTVFNNIVSVTGSNGLTLGTGPLITSGNVSIGGTMTGVGAVTLSSDLSVGGNLRVSGQITTVSSNSINVTDKDINLASNVTDPTLYDGGGMLLGSTIGTQVKLLYNYAQSAWDSNIGYNAAAGSAYTIAGGVNTTAQIGSTLNASGSAFGSSNAQIKIGASDVLLSKSGLTFGSATSVLTAGSLASTQKSSFAAGLSSGMEIEFSAAATGLVGSSAGTRLNLLPATLGAYSAADYALGIGSSMQWLNVPTGARHSIQVQGAEIVSVNASGLTSPAVNTAALTAGTITATANTSLTTMTASGASTLASATVTNALTAGSIGAGTLSTTGAASLSSATVTNGLNVSGSTTLAAVTSSSSTTSGTSTAALFYNPNQLFGTPSTSSGRSAGLKLMLYSQATNPAVFSVQDYCIGVGTNNDLWLNANGRVSAYIYGVEASYTQNTGLVLPTSNTNVCFGATTGPVGSAAGSKLVLLPRNGAGQATPTTTDYAIGVDSLTQWYNTGDATGQHRFYLANTLAASLNSSGFTTYGNVALTGAVSRLLGNAVSLAPSSVTGSSWVRLGYFGSTCSGTLLINISGGTQIDAVAVRIVYASSTAGDNSISIQHAGSSTISQISISSLNTASANHYVYAYLTTTSGSSFISTSMINLTAYPVTTGWVMDAVPVYQSNTTETTSVTIIPCSASMTVNGSAAFNSNLSVAGTLTTASFAPSSVSTGTLNTSGLATLNSATITNNLSVGGNLNVTGAYTPASISTGALTSTGTSSLSGTLSVLPPSTGLSFPIVSSSTAYVVNIGSGIREAAVTVHVTISGNGHSDYMAIDILSHASSSLTATVRHAVPYSNSTAYFTNVVVNSDGNVYVYITDPGTTGQGWVIGTSLVRYNTSYFSSAFSISTPTTSTDAIAKTGGAYTALTVISNGGTAHNTTLAANLFLNSVNSIGSPSTLAGRATGTKHVFYSQTGNLTPSLLDYCIGVGVNTDLWLNAYSRVSNYVNGVEYSYTQVAGIVLPQNNTFIGFSGSYGPPGTAAGTKLMLYPRNGLGTTAPSTTDYAIGLDGYTLWYNAGDSNAIHRFYIANTSYAYISTNGMVMQQPSTYMQFSASIGAPGTASGTKLILWPASGVGQTTTSSNDYSIGIDSNTLWYNGGGTTSQHSFTTAGTLRGRIDSNGDMLLTGQNLWIGAVNPSTNVPYIRLCCSGNDGYIDWNSTSLHFRNGYYPNTLTDVAQLSPSGVFNCGGVTTTGTITARTFVTGPSYMYNQDGANLYFDYGSNCRVHWRPNSSTGNTMSLDSTGNLVITGTMSMVNISASGDISCASGTLSTTNISAYGNINCSNTVTAQTIQCNGNLSSSACYTGGLYFYNNANFNCQTGNIRSDTIYNFHPGSVSGVVIDVNGYIGRNTSSARYKINVQDLPDPDSSAVLDRLRPITYQCNPETTGATDELDETVHLGFIAEEVELVDPRLVFHNAEGKPEALYYDRITVVLLKETKKLKTRVEILEAEKAALQTQVDYLYNYLNIAQ